MGLPAPAPVVSLPWHAPTSFTTSFNFTVPIHHVRLVPHTPTLTILSCVTRIQHHVQEPPYLPHRIPIFLRRNRKGQVPQARRISVIEPHTKLHPTSKRLGLHFPRFLSTSHAAVLQ